MAYQTIEVRKLTPAIGAEIFGVDLAKPLGNQQFQEVHDALMENLVIFFRDQELTHDQHKDFGRRFGKLHIHPTRPREPQHPEILVIKADANSKYIAGEEWHTDVSCDPEPPMGSILYMKELPPDNGGNTLFANMYRAYETLSAPIQKTVRRPDRRPRRRAGLWRPLRAHAAAGQELSAQRASGGAHASGDRPQGALRQPQLHHAHRRTSPSTRALRCSRCSTGTARRRSSSAASPGSPTPSPSGTTAAAMHHAMWDYFPHKRLGYRVTVAGDKPFLRA